MMTHKQRMLNAYKNLPADVVPAAPEFWFFYPAKVMKYKLDDFQREIPLWKGLLECFRAFDCEGWGSVGPEILNEHVKVTSEYKTLDEQRSRDTQTITVGGKEFIRTSVYSKTQPFWPEKFPINNNPDDIKLFFDANVNDDVSFDFSEANRAYEEIGEDYLCEFDLGFSFFDYFVQFMGFQPAVYYFMEEEEEVLDDMLQRYTEFQKRLLQKAVESTKFESYFIGCDSSCNSLFGPTMWRRWDKPYQMEIVKEAHRLDKLVHAHNHGKIKDTIPDLVQIGYDCVCPFERPPGDLVGKEGLVIARDGLQDKVTFNGNVHTIKTMINGTPEDVRAQVREIKEVFKGSNRLIVGTGDQVGWETPEENLYAMIDEAHKH